MFFISKLFIEFIVFSFIGWILEEIYGLYEEKKLVNRGFLIGPICPIYGVSCLILYYVLNPLSFNPILLFFASSIMCMIIEYLSSYILEKLFKVRYWDYHYMKFNLNGRICLETAIPFGLLGIILIYYAMPTLDTTLNFIHNNTINIIAIITFVLFLLDESCAIYLAAKHRHDNIETHEKDNTKEMKNYTKENIKNSAKIVKSKIESKRKTTK